jgi:hypothetical protein
VDLEEDSEEEDLDGVDPEEEDPEEDPEEGLIQENHVSLSSEADLEEDQR